MVLYALVVPMGSATEMELAPRTVIVSCYSPDMLRTK